MPTKFFLPFAAERVGRRAGLGPGRTRSLRLRALPVRAPIGE